MLWPELASAALNRSAATCVSSLQRMSVDRSYVERNTRERDRLRGLIERLSDDDLRRAVNEHWTVAGTLGHIAFWDARALVLTDKLERGVPFTSSDAEPDEVTWINDSTRALIHAIPPREAAREALRQAEETDRRVATLAPSLIGRTWPADPASPLNALRDVHRAEHLDAIETALGRRDRSPRDERRT